MHPGTASSKLGRAIAGIVTAGVLLACAHLAPAQSGSLPPRELPVEQQGRQVLNRLAFGPRPGQLQQVLAMGVDRWIDRQLDPSSINDSACDRQVATLPAYGTPIERIVASHPTVQAYLDSVRRARGLAPNAPVVRTAADTAEIQRVSTDGIHFAAQVPIARTMRAELCEAQLQEVMVDFWENHFNVYMFNLSGLISLLYYDRVTIRPHVLGHFRDLLRAVATSPAMLHYLNGSQSSVASDRQSLAEWEAQRDHRTLPRLSRGAGLNENYARELLELHTLGVDGGYTQQDVINVARILTGWSVTDSTRENFGFHFFPERHDAGEKVVLGHRFPAGRGIEEGYELLDFLARQPATAKHIATKLVRRFVSDSIPPALVTRAAETFMRTDGDIKEVVRTIVTSPEFFARVAYRAKVKSPFMAVMSAMRALDATADTTGADANYVGRLGEPLFRHQAPDGYPESGDAWLNAGSIIQRINVCYSIGVGNIKHANVANWPNYATLANASAEAQVNGVIDEVLGGEASPDTRAILMQGRNPLSPGTTASAQDKSAQCAACRLRVILGLALGSPEFQRH